MKYELKEFQEKAAIELADNMTYLMEGYSKKGKLGSCCLAAPTGSGKTVIAAAVIEALIEGSYEYDTAPDPDAAILWVTDLPSLSYQTRLRLLEATDLDPSRIESITNTFTQNHSQLEAGQVYFLHRQLLGKNKKLSGTGESLSFWQVLKDSISSGLHLYLFLDEAHRGLNEKGFGKASKDDETIYAQIIDGEDGNSPVPVVVGISATPQRFLNAMANRRNRISIPPVTVSPADVQASGLLKDDIILRAPIKSTAASHIYLSDACAALKDSTSRWAGWCALNHVDPPVEPLMVVQVPDKVSDSALDQLTRDIRSLLQDLKSDAFGHVFGDHTDRFVGGIEVPFVSPERVEYQRNVKVLFAKEAISTGWDCPRAEVIFSMRPHKDVTYITQLLGRMVRTPLAMRTDDETLNAVRCYLPEFDERSVKQVVGYLTSEESADWSGISTESGRNIIIDPIDVVWDHSLGIDKAFESVPKVVESHHPLNEIEAVLSFTALLAKQEIDLAAQKEAYKKLLQEIRNGIAIYSQEYADACESVRTVSSKEYHLTYLKEDSVTDSLFTQAADAFAVKNARKRADSIFTEALTNKFFASERGAHKSDLETNIVIAAAASVPEIVERVKKTAMDELNRLMQFYRSSVDELPEPARASFASVLSANGINRVVNLHIPEVGIQDKSHDKYVIHALSDPETKFAWVKTDSAAERKVIDRELKRCKAFYRNPSSGTGEHVLSVVYQHPNGGHRTLHPDFIFFENYEGRVYPSIIDPHWTLASDEALAKLRGLVRYAQQFGAYFARIWSVNGDATRYLDLLNTATRNAILDDSAKIDAIFKVHGKDYD